MASSGLWMGFKKMHSGSNSLISAAVVLCLLLSCAVACCVVPCCAVPCHAVLCLHCLSFECCSHDPDTMTISSVCMLSSHPLSHDILRFFSQSKNSGLWQFKNANLTMLLFCCSGLISSASSRPCLTLRCFWREVGSRQSSQTCSEVQAASSK